MGDNLIGEMIYTRIVFKCPRFEFWKFAVKFTRLIMPDLAQLLFDNMKIIDQPLR